MNVNYSPKILAEIKEAEETTEQIINEIEEKVKQLRSIRDKRKAIRDKIRKEINFDTNID